jgi:hypothetical protein
MPNSCAAFTANSTCPTPTSTGRLPGSIWNTASAPRRAWCSRTLPAQVSGRDLLLGLSDILEERYSNARLRLSEAIDCGGSMPQLFASPRRRRGPRIAATRCRSRAPTEDLPVPLRRALGEALVRRLLDAQARDAARMVADTLRRADPAPVPEMPLIDALLDAARGDVDAPRRASTGPAAKDGATLAIRLRLALERGEAPGGGTSGRCRGRRRRASARPRPGSI